MLWIIRNTSLRFKFDRSFSGFLYFKKFILWKLNREMKDYQRRIELEHNVLFVQKTFQWCMVVMMEKKHTVNISATYSFSLWSFLSSNEQFDSLNENLNERPWTFSNVTLKLFSFLFYLHNFWFSSKFIVITRKCIFLLSSLSYLMRYMHPLASSVHDQILFHFSI